MGQVKQNASNVGNGRESGRDDRRVQVEVQLRHLPADQLDLVAEVVAALASSNVRRSTEMAHDLQRLLVQEWSSGSAAEPAVEPAHDQAGGAGAGEPASEWDVKDLMALAESSLRVEWDTPEEDVAWAHLADLPTL